MEFLFFNLYSLPAIVALGLKLLLLGLTGVMPMRGSEAKVFLAFLFVLALHNVSEILVLNHPQPPDGTMINLRSGVLYFTMSVVAMAILFHLMLVRLRISTTWNVPVEDWRWTSLIYAPAAAVLLLLWMSEGMIQGFVPHGFSYTRVPGPQYHWFELYTLFYLVASLGLLIVSTAASRNRAQKRKNVIILIGMAPIITMPIVVVLLQKYGYNQFNLPLWFALGLTFFLIVVAYAIHEHRVFNVFFHLPGTRMRRRHTAFHQDIRSFVAELDRLPHISVEEALNKLASTLKCSVAMVEAGRKPIEAQPVSSNVRHLRFDRLGERWLHEINQIVLTKELKRDHPETYAKLNDANCAAVIPFRPFKETSAGWLLLGGGEKSADELPLDFTAVESLFDTMGDLFMENIVREREELNTLKSELDKQLDLNQELHQDLERKQDTIDALYGRYAAECAGPDGEVRLDDVTAGLEKKLISDTLARLQGNVSATAKCLGLTRQTLYAKMENYGINSDRWRRKKAARRRKTARK